MSKLRCSSEGVSSISQLLLNPLWEEHQTQLSLGSRSGFKSSELSDAEIGSAKKEASSMSKHSGSVLLACLCLCSGTAEDSDNFLVVLDFLVVLGLAGFESIVGLHSNARIHISTNVTNQSFHQLGNPRIKWI
jgi:hypothetical protein